MRRCLCFTWAIIFTAKSSLAPSSLLYVQNCSQQSFPDRSTPSLKHTQVYTSPKLFTHRQRTETKESLHYIRVDVLGLGRSGEAGLSKLLLSTQQKPLQVQVQPETRRENILLQDLTLLWTLQILWLILPCCVAIGLESLRAHSLFYRRFKRLQ